MALSDLSISRCLCVNKFQGCRIAVSAINESKISAHTYHFLKCTREENFKRNKMLSIKIVVILMMVSLMSSVPSPAVDTAPWAKVPEYFRAMEHGFRLDATQHHIHFVDRGKIFFLHSKIVQLEFGKVN